jgi:hypothetical protein
LRSTLCLNKGSIRFPIGFAHVNHDGTPAVGIDMLHLHSAGDGPIWIQAHLQLRNFSDWDILVGLQQKPIAAYVQNQTIVGYTVELEGGL